MNTVIVGTIEGVYVGVEPVVSEPRPSIMAALEGIVGDRHFGWSKPAGVREKALHAAGTPIWNGRQWSAVSVEELEETALRYGVPEIKPEWVGANLLVRGIPDFTRIPAMSRLLISNGPVLLVLGANRPCIHPGLVIARHSGPGTDPKLFARAAAHRRGLVGWVERAGEIAPGAAVEVRLP
jgi:hypothetical protein